jgi:hypothetical protein
MFIPLAQKNIFNLNNIENQYFGFGNTGEEEDFISKDFDLNNDVYFLNQIFFVCFSFAISLSSLSRKI